MNIIRPNPKHNKGIRVSTQTALKGLAEKNLAREQTDNQWVILPEGKVHIEKHYKEGEE